MPEGREWDSIATPAHCEFCMSLGEFSAFCFLSVFFEETGAAKPSCLTERLLGTCSVPG